MDNSELVVNVRIHVEGNERLIAAMTAIVAAAAGISKADQALLDALNERSARIARKLERLDARTK